MKGRWNIFVLVALLLMPALLGAAPPPPRGAWFIPTPVPTPAPWLLKPTPGPYEALTFTAIVYATGYDVDWIYWDFGHWGMDGWLQEDLGGAQVWGAPLFNYDDIKPGTQVAMLVRYYYPDDHVFWHRLEKWTVGVIPESGPVVLKVSL